VSHIVNAGLALGLNLSAVPITGNASGSTPMVSSWLKLAQVDTAVVTLATAVGTGGVWTAQVATNAQGKGAIPVPNPPAWPTGTHQSASVTVQMPGGEYRYLQLTFTPNAGSGAVTATFGVITGLPVLVRERQLGMFYVVPAADNLAGSHALEYSGNYDGTVFGGQNKPLSGLNNTPSEPSAWCPAVDASGSAISIAAVAGSGQTLPLRLGIFEFVGVRAKFTPTSGSGHLRVYSNRKA